MAAKRAKRERQKQRKRAEAAAATAARVESLADPASEYEEPSNPVPELEEAPELDFDFHGTQQVEEMISLFKKEGMGRDAPLEIEELVPPPRRDTVDR